jgi:hypothetical protein
MGMWSNFVNLWQCMKHSEVWGNNLIPNCTSNSMASSMDLGLQNRVIVVEAPSSACCCEEASHNIWQERN